MKMNTNEVSMQSKRDAIRAKIESLSNIEKKLYYHCRGIIRERIRNIQFYISNNIKKDEFLFSLFKYHKLIPLMSEYEMHDYYPTLKPSFMDKFRKCHYELIMLIFKANLEAYNLCIYEGFLCMNLNIKKN